MEQKVQVKLTQSLPLAHVSQRTHCKVLIQYIQLESRLTVLDSAGGCGRLLVSGALGVEVGCLPGYVVKE